MRVLTFTLICLFPNFCCTAQHKLPDLYKFSDSSLLNSSQSVLDFDNPNKIFKPNRDFIFSYYVPSSDITTQKKPKFSIVPHFHINGSDTILNFDTKLETQPFNNVIDRVRLCVINRRFNDTLLKNQTVVKYEFSNYRGVMNLISEVAGLTEDTNQISMPTPQSACFTFLAYAPYPQIDFKATQNSWRNPQTISLNRVYKNLPPLAIEMEYTKLGFEDFYFEGRFIKCQVIRAQSLPNYFAVSSKATFLFNEEYGFVKTNYSVIVAGHEDKVIFNLIRVEDDKLIQQTVSFK